MLSPRKSWTEMDLLPLVCLCVLTWSRGTFADPDGPLITTITVEEDDDVVLPCSFNTSDIRDRHFNWTKDGQENVFTYQSGSTYENGLIGQAADFKGRVSHFEDRLQSGNASIYINKTKVSDKGTYSCDFPSDGGIRSQIELVVGPLITTITVEEGKNVVLPCSFNTSDIRNKHFDWNKDGQQNVFTYQSGSTYENGLIGQAADFKGRVSHFEDRLQSGDASIYINKTKVSDKGTYSCDFTPDGGKRSQIQLLVECILKDRTQENIPGSCPQPSVTTRKTDEGVLLKCEVKHASPEPEVKWQDSDGNTVPSKDPQISKNGDYSDIILLAAVTKEGDYQCVVKQTEICHQVHSEEIFWHPHGSASGLTSGSSVLVGAILGVALLL